jgi:transglutaminase-like putative cysteine protease
MIDYLPHRTLLRLLVVLMLVIAPHLPRLPLWESAAIALIVLWRAVASSRQWALPPQALKLALAIAAFVGVYASFGRITGQNAGVALLVLMVALKLTEMRSRRDVMVVMFLMYFLLVTHFLNSQEIWTIAYLFVSVIAITAVLVDAHHPGEPLPLRQSVHMGGRMIVHALPVMLLFFVLFPRIPGPLWGLPNDAGPPRSGLSDSMSPGDISQLMLSSEVAFRVRFEGPAPSKDQQYWRGPVFSDFNGRTWRQSSADLLDRSPPTVEAIDPVRIRYELTLEPMRSRWLFALDVPDPRALPPDSRIERSGALVVDRLITERRLVRGVSAPRYRLDPVLDDEDRERTTFVPEESNPRTAELALQWRDGGMDDEAIVNAALRMFRDEPFFYTLEPPRLGRHAADEFLFDTRRGFCEHYSSAFAVLMREAGVPARVVTGYQGMEANDFGDYFVVRQSDAHAWNEVWLEGRGWIRIDPTAMVHPSRIEQSTLAVMESLSRRGEGLDEFQRLRYMLEDQWDAINARWNEWVLGYGPEMQARFLELFGLADTQRMLLALTIGVCGSLALIGLIAMRRSSPPRITERALLLWRDATRRLARFGYAQRPDEGPRDFVQRVIGREPELADPLGIVLDAYLRLRYAGESSAALERDFALALKRIRRPSAR